MRRGLIGLGLLAALLALGIWTQSRMDALHTPIAEAMSQAGALAGQERWEEAGAIVQQAKQQWAQGRTLTAALADHQPMEDIESLMAQLDAFLQDQEPDFGALCADIARRIDAMAAAHRMELGTLF